MWTKWLFFFLPSKGHFSIEKKKKKIRRKVIFVQLMPRSNPCPKRNMAHFGLAIYIKN
jgi:hypothetical protein